MTKRAATPDELVHALVRTAEACGWHWREGLPDWGLDLYSGVWIDDKLYRAEP